MSTKPNIPEEEIDLGTLFNQIGKMFSNFFAFIGNIFNSIYHYGIIFLLFIRKNIIFLGLATLIGGIVGYLLSLNQESVYTSEMEVEASYGSANQLYKQIGVVNNLIADKDTIKIAELFDIPVSQTAWVSGFTIEPIEPEKQKYLAYDRYMQETDTIYTRDFKFEDFVKRFKDKDLRSYKIIGMATRPENFQIFTNGFIKFVETEFYISLKNEKLSDLNFSREEYKKDVSQLDSLRKLYKEVALLKAREQNNDAANLNLTTSNLNYKNFDMDLYQYSFILIRSLEELNKKIAEHDNILDISTDFGIAIERIGLINKSWFKYAVFGFILALLVLYGIQFNRYLNNYKKKLVK